MYKNLRKLILVKHSLPEQNPQVVASQWRLSQEGRRRCIALAEKIAIYQPAIIVTSVEPKAIETAALLSDNLGISFEEFEGLHEHDRNNVGYLAKKDFEAAVEAFFDRPAELVLGRETATQALARFSAAIERVLLKYSSGNVVIVTHGTVLTLFTASHTNVKAFPYWQSLSLPSMTILTLPKFELEKTVGNIS